MNKAIILGVQGTELTKEEERFFSQEHPVGFILFSRNIKDKTQVKSLVHNLRKTIKNPHAPILIDQEGGRVARLKEPNWYHPPAANTFGKIAAENMKDAKHACKLNAKIIGNELHEMGINVNCAPVLDIPVKNANDVIGDRAFSHDKETIIELAEAFIDGLNSSGTNHVIKHIPGHGRSLLDSHFELPIIETKLSELNKTDFVPFVELKKSQWAMTAHIIYKDIDPFNPATHSKSVVDIIRKKIGFENIIITDCITMQALKEGFKINAQKAFEAGCDLVLFSKPDLKDAKDVLSVTPTLSSTQEKKIFHTPEFCTKEKTNTLIEKLNKIFDKYKLKKLEPGKDPTTQHI